MYEILNDLENRGVHERRRDSDISASVKTPSDIPLILIIRWHRKTLRTTQGLINSSRLPLTLLRVKKARRGRICLMLNSVVDFFYLKELLLLFITREHDRYRSIIGQCFGQTGG